MKKEDFDKDSFKKDLTDIYNKYFSFDEKATAIGVEDTIEIFTIGYKTKFANKNEIIEKVPFEKALQTLINQYSMENDSNTPDYILADYLTDCLDSFNKATNRRNKHYNRKL
jgi:hypothetical protein